MVVNGKEVRLDAAMLVSRCRNILRLTIPATLKFAGRILLVMDNEDVWTRDIVSELVEAYPGRVVVVKSGFPVANDLQELEDHGLYRRFRVIQGEVRDRVFQEIRGWAEKPEVLLFIDSDEYPHPISFPFLMDRFLSSGKGGVMMRSVTPIGDRFHAMKDGMAHHLRLMLWRDDLTALPYRQFTQYHPLEADDLMRDDYSLVHNCYLTAEKRAFRGSSWSKAGFTDDTPVWSFNKSVDETSATEIKKELFRGPDTTAGKLLAEVERYIN